MWTAVTIGAVTQIELKKVQLSTFRQYSSLQDCKHENVQCSKSRTSVQGCWVSASG